MIREAVGRALLAGLRAASAAEHLIQGPAHLLDKGDLLAEARKETGLSDFGPADFEDGLEALLSSCRRDADLTALGRAVVRSECLRLLTNNLLMAEVRRESPEIAELPVERPVFIVGLPRSGTTFLHTALGAVPGMRTPKLSEMLYPVSAFRGESLSRAQCSGVRWLRLLNPGLAGIHEVRLDAPEECTFLLQHSFRSFMLGLAVDAPSYVAWLHRQDPHGAYLYHRWQLQMLSAPVPRTRWLLKSPAHTLALPTISRVYPDARFIFLHRDPLEVLGSLCSLRENLLRMTLRSVSRQRIGTFTAMAVRMATDRVIEAVDALEPDRVLHVTFDRLMSDPTSVAERACSFLGDLRDPTLAAVGDRIRARPPRRGRHNPELRRYGIARGHMEATFARYRGWSRACCTGANA